MSAVRKTRIRPIPVPAAASLPQPDVSEVIPTPARTAAGPLRYYVVPPMHCDFHKCAVRSFAPDQYDPSVLRLFSRDSKLQLVLPAAASALLDKRLRISEFAERCMTLIVQNLTTACVAQQRQHPGLPLQPVTITITARELRRLRLFGSDGRRHAANGERISEVKAFEQVLQLLQQLRFFHLAMRKCDPSGQPLQHCCEEHFANLSLISDYEMIHDGRGFKEVRLSADAGYIAYLMATGQMARRHPAGYAFDERAFGFGHARGGHETDNHRWRIARWTLLHLNLHATYVQQGQMTAGEPCEVSLASLYEYCPELEAQLERYASKSEVRRKWRRLRQLLSEVGAELDLFFELPDDETVRITRLHTRPLVSAAGREPGPAGGSDAAASSGSDPDAVRQERDHAHEDELAQLRAELAQLRAELAQLRAEREHSRGEPGQARDELAEIREMLADLRAVITGFKAERRRARR